MPTWTTDRITIPYTYVPTTATTWTNTTDCAGITGHYTGFVTKDELKEAFDNFAKSIFKTLQEMKYLNKDISEEEFMAVLNDEGE